MFEIGKVCIDEKDLFSALNNLEKAKLMFENEGNEAMAMQTYDYLAFVMHEVRASTQRAIGYRLFSVFNNENIFLPAYYNILDI